MSSWAQIASKNIKSKLDVKPEVKPNVKPEVKPDVKPDVKPEAKPEVKPNVKPEVKPEVKPNVKPNVKPVVKPIIRRCSNKDVYLVDIGSNLTSSKFESDLDEVIKRARDGGVQKQVITGSSIKESHHALDIARKYPGEFYSTAGIHPHNASQYTPECVNALEALLSNPEVVAVGETGLDFFRNISTHEQQKESFEAHLKLAFRLKKPLFLHQRDAHTDFMNTIEYVMTQMKLDWKDLPPIVVHCFTGKSKELEEYIRVGFYVGITGFIGIKGRGDNLLSFLAHKVPLEKLMIETDAPYMKPNNAPKLPSGNNEPCNLQYVAEIIAPLYKISEEELWKITTKNAEKFFGI